MKYEKLLPYENMVLIENAKLIIVIKIALFMAFRTLHSQGTCLSFPVVKETKSEFYCNTIKIMSPFRPAGNTTLL